jgi:hypothetical protein
VRVVGGKAWKIRALFSTILRKITSAAQVRSAVSIDRQPRYDPSDELHCR